MLIFEKVCDIIDRYGIGVPVFYFVKIMTMLLGGQNMANKPVIAFNGTPEQEELLDAVIAKYKDTTGALIPVLHEAQDIYGYLSLDAINYISEETGIKPAKIYGVATFYAQFRLKPVGKYLIMLCQGTACHVNGSEMIEEAICEYLDIKDGETTEDGIFTLNNVACLGCCSLAPVMMVKSVEGDETYGNLTKDSVKQILGEIR